MTGLKQSRLLGPEPRCTGERADSSRRPLFYYFLRRKATAKMSGNNLREAVERARAALVLRAARIGAMRRDALERARAALANAAADFDEAEHPRDKGGKFTSKEGEGRKAETFAYERDGRKFKLDGDGRHLYADEPQKEGFGFGKMMKPPKTKPTPNLDAFRDVPDTGKSRFSQMDEADVYRRGERVGDGKDGKAAYKWTLGGKPVSPSKAAKLEAAFKEAGIMVFDPNAKSAMVRRDFANGRGQLFSYTAANGRVQTRQDRRTELENAEGKFRSVKSVVEKYDRIFGSIASDAAKGSAEANVAYFLTRTKCRIGGSGKNDNLGALDLTADNVKVIGDKVRLDFDAKNAHWKQELTDRRLASWLKRRIAETPQGEPILGSATSPAKVNGYLTAIGEKAGVVRDAKGKGFTAHNIRHAGATRLASQLVDGITIDPKKDRKGYLAALSGVVVRCGRHICDSPKVAMERYIHDAALFKNAPDLLEEYRRAYANSADGEASNAPIFLEKSPEKRYNTGMRNDNGQTVVPHDGFIGGEGEGVEVEATATQPGNDHSDLPYGGNFDDLTGAEILDLCDRDCDEEEDGPSQYTGDDLDNSPFLRELFLSVLKKEYGIEDKKAESAKA